MKASQAEPQGGWTPIEVGAIYFDWDFEEGGTELVGHQFSEGYEVTVSAYRHDETGEEVTIVSVGERSDYHGVVLGAGRERWMKQYAAENLELED